MSKDLWAIVGVGAVLLGVVLSTWMASRTDNRENIREVEENLRGDIIRVEERLGDDINRVHDDINRVEERLGGDISRVHGDIRILLEHALRGQSDGSERPSENAQD